MAVADHIADFKLIIAINKAYRAWWAATGTTKVAAVASGVAADLDGRLNALTKDRAATTGAFANVALYTRVLLSAWAVQLARTLNYNDVNPNSFASVMRGLRRYMLANSKVFKSRGVTHSAPSYSVATKGKLITHTADEDTYTLENVTDETLTFKCVADVSQGVESGAESFEVYGENPARDNLELGGSRTDGQPFSIQCIGAAQQQSLANGDFSQALSGSGTDKIPGWTINGTAANVTAHTTAADLFRIPLSGTSQAMKFAADEKIYQALSNLPTDTPVCFGFWWNRAVGSGDNADLYVRGGSVSNTVNTGTTAGWNLLYKCAWPKQFSGAGNDFEIEVDNLASGYVLCSNAFAVPMQKIGGRWHAIVAGPKNPSAGTPTLDWAIGDYITQDTSVASSGINKDELYRLYEEEIPELPHNGTASSGYEDAS